MKDNEKATHAGYLFILVNPMLIAMMYDNEKDNLFSSIVISSIISFGIYLFATNGKKK